MMRHWHRLPSKVLDVLDVLFLETPKVRLDGALSNLIRGRPCLLQESWTKWLLKSPSKSNDSTVLWILKSFDLWLGHIASIPSAIQGNIQELPLAVLLISAGNRKAASSLQYVVSWHQIFWKVLFQTVWLNRCTSIVKVHLKNHFI